MHICKFCNKEYLFYMKNLMSYIKNQGFMTWGLVAVILTMAGITYYDFTHGEQDLIGFYVVGGLTIIYLLLYIFDYRKYIKNNNTQNS